MERDRPIVGLDVDGVVALERPAAVEAREHRVSAWGRWTRTILVPTCAAGVLARLASDVEVVWVSAWGHNAHTALQEVLDLPCQPWAFLPVQFDKAQAVAAHAGERPWGLVHDGVDRVGEAPAGGVIIEVDGRRGLADVDPDRLLRRLGPPAQRTTPRWRGLAHD